MELANTVSVEPLESRRLMSFTTTFAEIPISTAALAADPTLGGYHTFDLRVTVPAGAAWSGAHLHLTLRRGELYVPDASNHLAQLGYWSLRPNLAYASVLADDGWAEPPEGPGNVFGTTHVDADWFAIDGRKSAAAPRTITVARLTISSDASGVILAQTSGFEIGHPPTQVKMFDVYQGRVYGSSHGYVSGSLYDDGDGARSGDELLSGRTVYLDADHDGTLDANERRTTTNANGFYEFYGLPRGTYKIRQVLPAGFGQTTPHHDFGWSVPLWPGHAVQELDFGSAKAPLKNAAISGSFFKDLNGNGQRDAGDADTWEWPVYLDGNRDGVLDAGDVSTMTLGTDWQFTGLAAGTYVVRYLAKPGKAPTTVTSYTVTLAESEVRTGLLFGVRLVS